MARGLTLALLAIAALAWRRRAQMISPAIVNIPPCEPMRANVLLREYPGS